MKIISWNCNMKFRSKIHLIESFKPDIAIIQECEHIDKIDTSNCTSIWIGENRHKGVGIFSFTGKKLEIAPWHDTNFKYIIPIYIDDILLFAISPLLNTFKKFFFFHTANLTIPPEFTIDPQLGFRFRPNAIK